MKVKVCYARVRVTGMFSTSESTKTRLLNKRLKKFAADGQGPQYLALELHTVTDVARRKLA